MVVLNRDRELSELLNHLVRALDVPEEMYATAVSHYGRVGRWLVDHPSSLAPHAEDVYVQGSFRIGTAIRPLTEADEYDIDCVAPLNLDRETTSKDELKRLIGDRLRESPEYRRLLEKEKRRCWTLSFGDGFHMDVLPAIPKGAGSTSIWIGDKDKHRWLTSDPAGFAAWFVETAGRVFLMERKRLAVESRANVEQVPLWRVKTPLHRVIQMLKRHRDYHFQDERIADLRPASIVLTVLAARAYRGETETWEAFRNAAAALDGLVVRTDGKYVISNPTNDAENFADRWNDEGSRLPGAFFAWTRKLREDLGLLADGDGLDTLGRVLSESFGRGASHKALNAMTGGLREARDRGVLRSAGGVLVAGGAAGRAVGGHTFYGSA